MDKASERSLQQVMEGLFARQSEEMKEMEARAEASQEKADADTKARHVRFLAFLDRLSHYGKGTTTCQTETTSCPGEMEATNLEATPEETEAAVERKELFKEETYSNNIGSSEDLCKGRRLVVRRRRGAKKRSQNSVGSRLKLSAARKRVIRLSVPAVRKGKIRKCPGKDNVARGASRGKTIVKSRRPCHNGRWHRETKKPSYPMTRKTTDRILRKTLDQEVAKRARLSTNKMQDVIYWTFWNVRPPPKRKKELRTA
jgi:hypothetical protein